MSSRPRLVNPTQHRFNKRSDAAAQLAWRQAREGKLEQALQTLGKATVSDDLACLGLALSLATENTVGLTLWGGIVREASERSPRCTAVLARLEAWDGESRFQLYDFQELSDRLAGPRPVL